MIFRTDNAFERAKAKAYFGKLVDSGKTIEVTEKRERRTLSQNALFHVWVKVVADHAGYASVEDCKRDVKRTLLGTREVVNRLTGEIGRDDYHTSGMTVAELSSLMDRMKAWALADLGCYLPYYRDPGYEEMLRQYGRP